MNKKVQKVLTLLKPKVKALGFSKEEVKGIAAKIADKLESEDDASEEDIESEINEKIDEALPMLQYVQSASNRLIDNYKKQNKIETDDDDDDDSDEDDASQKKSGSKKSPNNKKQDEVPAWAQALIDSNKKLNDELTAMKQGKTTDARRAKLEKLLKDTGTFGKTTLKQFEKMSFNDDDDFDEFLEGVEGDLADLNQERANSGLDKLGVPPAGKKDKSSEKEVVSDDDIKAMAKM